MSNTEEIDKAGAYTEGRELITSAILAAQKGDLPSLQSLLKFDTLSKLNEISEGNSRRLIHFAAMFGHIHVLEWIISQGADAFILDDDQNSISSLATYSERQSTLEWVISRFPSLLHHKNNKQMTLLHIAAETTNTDIVEMLIEKGLGVNDESENGTPLELAIMWKQMGTAKVLLERGADPNGMKGKLFPPAVVMAASMNNREAVELLVAYGADLGITAKDKVTALEVAFEFGFDFAEFLLGKGAPVTSQAIVAAFKNNRKEILDRILKVSTVEKREQRLEKKAEAEEMKVKGNEEFYKGNYSEAVRFYTSAIEVCECSIYYSNRGQAYILIGKFEEGVEDARVARGLDEGNVKAYIREGQGLVGLGKQFEALGCFWEAFKREQSQAIEKLFIDTANNIQ